jgi:CRP-like cAMP-binding protein
VHEEQTQMIQSFDSGDRVGEWEFYCQVEYQHSAVASKASTIHCLSMDAMHKMREESPQVANILAQSLLESFAKQLSKAKQEITMLQQERSETVGRLTAS